MPFAPHATPLLFTLSAILMAVGALLYRALSHAWRRRRIAKRFKRGSQGESAAKRYLLSHGYKILAYQAELSPRMWIDGEETGYRIIADFIVEKRRRTAVVEVKTGSKAIAPAGTDTRRQIFEYYHLFGTDDFLLFDAEHEKLHSIGFAAETSPRSTTAAWVYGFIVGAIVAGLIAAGAWIGIVH
jgi:hypothetical protein